LNIWSDGCKGQFKTKYHFYFLSKLRNVNLPDCIITHNFFASNHGHNQCDQEAGVHKSKQREYERLFGSQLKDASEFKSYYDDYDFTVKKYRSYCVVDTIETDTYSINDWDKSHGMVSFHKFLIIDIGQIKLFLIVKITIHPSNF